MMIIRISSIARVLIGISLVVFFNTANATTAVSRWGPIVKREGQAVYGINSPTPMFLGQIQQESGGNPNVTAKDLGRGIAQFMDATSKQVVGLYPNMGPADPYNPTWAIRALLRLHQHNLKYVKGKTDCDKWSATLKAYNAGLGYVLWAEKSSSDPDTWYGVTEDINIKQSTHNFLYSRWYSRTIIFHHQPNYLSWGGSICNMDEPFDKYPLK